MNFHYPKPMGVIRPGGSYRQFGHMERDETGTDHVSTVDLSFRMTTNGVIVNTLINDEPVITTSAGTFNQ
jgi:hypothetical protein